MKRTVFDRIVGYKEEKKELIDICNLIKKRNELKKAGGKLPRGLFLTGPNGVGKTILAKCFIEESGCESVIISYNDLDSNADFLPYVKSKFANAASKAPCILFIDELDKLIGTSRSFYMGDNCDRSRAILNEINKYSDVDGLFLLVVANQNFSVDYSIIRSGRIDRVIEINLPSETERKEILSYYSTGKQFDESVNFDRLSQLLSGFSGADIESLLNDAVIRTFNDKRVLTTHEDLMSSYYDKIFCSKQKDGCLDEKSQRMVAYHEAGHTAVTILINPMSLNCATILSRNGVKGFVSCLSSDDVTKTFEDEKNNIRIALAGLISEEIFFGERSNGSLNDILKAKSIIDNLVRKHGICGLDKVLLSYDDFPPLEKISNDKLKRIEEAEDNLLKELYNSTKTMIENSKDMVTSIANELMSKKILNKEDIDKISKLYAKRKEPTGPSLL